MRGMDAVVQAHLLACFIFSVEAAMSPRKANVTVVFIVLLFLTGLVALIQSIRSNRMDFLPSIGDPSNAKSAVVPAGSEFGKGTNEIREEEDAHSEDQTSPGSERVDSPARGMDSIQEPRLTEAVVLTGRVLSAETGLGIEGVVVEGRVASVDFPQKVLQGTRFQAKTDAGGRYIVSMSSVRGAAQLYISARHPEYAPLLGVRCNLPSHSQYMPEIALIPLSQAGSVGGTVVDESGIPVSGCGVVFVADLPWREIADMGEKRFPSAVSDPSGRFELTGLPLSPGKVAAIRDGRCVGSSFIPLSYCCRRVDGVKLSVVLEGQADGRILDPFGYGVPGCEVGVEESFTLTDGDGRFFLSPTGKTPITLRVNPPLEFMDMSVPVNVPAAASDMVIQLKPREYLAIRLHAEHQENIGRLDIICTKSENDNAWQQFRLSAKRDLDGLFRLYLSGAGNSLHSLRKIEVFAAGHMPSQVELNALSQGDVIDVTLLRGFRLKGRVVDFTTGEPVAEARVECRDSPSGRSASGRSFSPPCVADTDADGRFELTCAFGRVSVVVWKEGYAPGICEDFSIEGGAALPDIALLRGGTLSGEVRDAEGRAVRGVLVRAHLYRRNVISWEQARVTDADGRYHFDTLAAGQYQVTCWLDADWNAQRIVEIDDTTDAIVNLTLPRITRVSGSLPEPAFHRDTDTSDGVTTRLELQFRNTEDVRRIRPAILIGTSFSILLSPGTYDVTLERKQWKSGVVLNQETLHTARMEVPDSEQFQYNVPAASSGH